MDEKRSEFVLQHDDGTYHAIGKGHAGTMGFDTIDRVAGIERAKRYGSYDFAVSDKNNTSHLRHCIGMKVIELRYEVIDRGEVPVTKPDWDDFDEYYDAESFAYAQAESAKRQGRLAAEARQRIMSA